MANKSAIIEGVMRFTPFFYAKVLDQNNNVGCTVTGNCNNLQ